MNSVSCVFHLKIGIIVVVFNNRILYFSKYLLKGGVVMKFKNLYTNEVYKEKQLLADNYEKVVDSNNDFTKVILKIGGFCFFMLFITSMFIPSYYNLRIVYFGAFTSFSQLRLYVSL